MSLPLLTSQSLKALLLEDCFKLKKAPYLGKLKALRDLNLSGTAIKEAPLGLEGLLELRFLSMNAPGLKMLPRVLLLKLGHLQHLNLPLYIKLEIEEIKYLKKLEEFHGGVKNVNDFNCFITTRVHDPCYRIRVSSNISDRPRVLLRQLDSEACPPRFGIEDGLGCHNNELVLFRCDLKDEKVLGQGAVDLTIRECACFVDDLPGRFNNPTSLKRVHIVYCGGIEWMRSDCQGSEITLQEIYLSELDYVKGVVMMERGEIHCTYTRLKRISKATIICDLIRGISITWCPRLMNKLPLHMDVVPPPSLQVIRVEREWWETLEWDINPNLLHLLQDFVEFKEW